MDLVTAVHRILENKLHYEKIVNEILKSRNKSNFKRNF